MCYRYAADLRTYWFEVGAAVVSRVSVSARIVRWTAMCMYELEWRTLAFPLAGESASDCACVPVHARACTIVQVRSISFAIQKPRADDIGALWQLVNGAIDSLGMLVPITTCAVEVPSHRSTSCASLRIH